MKIAIFCPNYPPAEHEGGIEHYAQLLARYLCKLGEEVFIITGDGYCGHEFDGEVTVLNFPEEWKFSTTRKMVAHLKSLKIDAVNLQYSPVMYSNKFKFTWHYISRYFPSSVSFHTLWGGSKINHLFALGLMLSTNQIIATNSEIIYLIKKYSPFFLTKTQVIPIGANIQPSDDKGNYKEIANKYFSDTNRLVLVFFGMSYPGKGMNLLFETMRLLLEKYKLNIQLLMVGGGISDLPEYVEEKKRLSSLLGIEDRVAWTGRIPAEEVSVLLNRSDAVILPFEAGVSDRRGSLMAALAHHKAVVTTRPAILMAFFESGHNMIWPERNDASSLAEVIANILTNHDLRKRLENGAAELHRNYQWPGIARQYRDCLGKILEEKNT